jgi:hypothetical protein
MWGVIGLLIFFPSIYAAESCNNEYCLAYETGKLVKYNGDYTDLTLQAGIRSDEAITAIAWSGKYWLIGISNWNGTPSRPFGTGYTSKLLKFDGEVFTDLSLAAKLNETRVRGAKPKIISHIRCIEDYCLIGYWIPLPVSSGGVMKYDGEFKEISVKGGQVKDMLWNGEYWLIWYLLGEFRPSNLEKFDGTRSVALSLFDLRQNERYWITNISWNATGKYWLISARVGTPGAWSPTGKPEIRNESVIYDGREVIPISPEKTPTREKTYIALAALIFLLIFIRRRRKS